MKRIVLGLAAALTLATVPAFADDYVALCKVNEEGNLSAEKLCLCASSKVKPEDRAAAIAAMKAMSDFATGRTPDTSSADMTRGTQAVMTAEAQCGM
jgi:hypothetical protein